MTLLSKQQIEKSFKNVDMDKVKKLEKKSLEESWPKLPVKFKEKWLAALRSGKYKQGYGSLLTDYGEYCCLGVACKVAGVSDKNLKSLGEINTKKSSLGVPKILLSVPNVMKILINKLVFMNDDGEKSFIEIADWIDKNL